MSDVPTELRDEIPTFEEGPAPREHGPLDWSALTSIRTAKSALEIASIVALFAAVFFDLEGALR